MPLDIKGIVLHGFYITEIKRLLKNKGSQHGVKLLRGTVECRVKIFFDSVDGNIRQYMLAE